MSLFGLFAALQLSAALAPPPKSVGPATLAWTLYEGPIGCFLESRPMSMGSILSVLHSKKDEIVFVLDNPAWRSLPEGQAVEIEIKFARVMSRGEIPSPVPIKGITRRFLGPTGDITTSIMMLFDDRAYEQLVELTGFGQGLDFGFFRGEAMISDWLPLKAEAARALDRCTIQLAGREKDPFAK